MKPIRLTALLLALVLMLSFTACTLVKTPSVEGSDDGPPSVTEPGDDDSGVGTSESETTITADNILDLNENASIFVLDDKCGVVDNLGNILQEPSFAYIGVCPYHGIYAGDENGKTVMLDPVTFAVISEEGCAHGLEGYADRIYYCQRYGAFYLMEYGDLTPVYDGFFTGNDNYTVQEIFFDAEGNVSFLDSYGYYDDGEFVYKSELTDVRPYSEGLAPVEVDGRWGYMDTDGNIVVECRYEPMMLEYTDEYLRPCVNDCIVVREFGFLGLIDRGGNELLPCNYSGISNVHGGKVWVCEEGNTWSLLTL